MAELALSTATATPRIDCFDVAADVASVNAELGARGVAATDVVSIVRLPAEPMLDAKAEMLRVFHLA